MYSCFIGLDAALAIKLWKIYTRGEFSLYFIDAPEDLDLYKPKVPSCLL